jgi:hypothetical protein
VWLGAGVVFAAGSLMVAWTWRSWPDPLVDFGAEIYLAWRLSLGEHLYADYVYPYGPLSPYWNALWFRIAGVSFLSLAMLNLALAAALAGLLYRHFLRISGTWGAVLAGSTFALLFAASQYVSVANYNYLSPYAHPLTHGVLLSVLLLAILARAIGPEPASGRATWTWPAAAGVVLGLVFLTKLEVFVAAASAAAAAMGAWLWLSHGARPVWRASLVMLATVPIPILVAWGLLSSAMEADVAWRGFAGAWTAIVAGDAGRLPIFREGMGLDDPGGNLRAIGVYTGAGACALVAIVAVVAAIGRVSRGRPILRGRPTLRGRPILGWVAVAALAGAILAATAWLAPDHVYHAGKPLPVFLLAILAFDGALLLRRGEHADRRRLVRFVFAVFALALLSRMILNPRIHHYGFALAMPATLLAAAVAIDSLPRRLAAWRIDPSLLRASLLAVWVGIALAHLDLTRQAMQLKETRVGQGADAFYADVRGMAVNEVSAALRTIISPDQTLVVLPEGAMFNYLLRLQNPTGYIQMVAVLPPGVGPYGQDAIEQAFTTHPPDFILLVHKDTSEFGSRFFGKDYAQDLFRWIEREYDAVATWYGVPLQDDRFGVRLLQRTQEPIAPAPTAPAAP